MASAYVNIVDTHCQLLSIALSHFSVRKQKLRLEAIVFRKRLQVLLVGWIQVPHDFDDGSAIVLPKIRQGPMS